MATPEDERRRQLRNRTPRLTPSTPATDPEPYTPEKHRRRQQQARQPRDGQPSANAPRRGLPPTPEIGSAGSQPLDTTTPTRSVPARQERRPAAPSTNTPLDRRANLPATPGGPLGNTGPDRASQAMHAQAEAQRAGDLNQQANQQTDQQIRDRLQPRREALAQRQAQTQGEIDRRRQVLNQTLVQDTNQIRDRMDTFGPGGTIDQGQTHTIDPAQAGAGQRGAEIQRGGGEVRYAPAAPSEAVARLARGRGGLVGEAFGQRRLPATPEEAARARAFDQAAGAARPDPATMPEADLAAARAEREQMGLAPVDDAVLQQQWARGQAARAARGTEDFQTAQQAVMDQRGDQRRAALDQRAETLQARTATREEARRNRLLGMTPGMQHEQQMMQMQVEAQQAATAAERNQPVRLRPGERAVDPTTGQTIGEGRDPAQPTQPTDVVNIGGRPWSRTQNRFLDAEPPLPARELDAMVGNVWGGLGLGKEGKITDVESDRVFGLVGSLVDSRYGNLPVEQRQSIAEQIILSLGLMPDVADADNR